MRRFIWRLFASHVNLSCILLMGKFIRNKNNASQQGRRYHMQKILENKLLLPISAVDDVLLTPVFWS